ncbi:MAG: SRPBCC family protein [Mycobacterium sp.]
MWPKSKPLSGEASRHSNVAPETLWDLLTDVTRMGQWSPECTGGQWLDGATEAAEGARFRGTNRWGPLKWSTTCHVDEADRPRRFGYRAHHRSGALTRWSYELIPDAGGTLLIEKYETVGTPTLVLLLDRISQRPRRLQRGMSTTLARLSAAAEGR